MTHALYGTPPLTTDADRAERTQYSPLIPGSATLDDCAPETLASALIYAPPGTIERRYVLAQTLRALAPDAPLTALAPKDKGGSRLAGELRSFGCAVTTDSARHHRICTTRRPAVLTGIEEALAAGAPRFYPALTLWTQPGIFSWDRIDPGSALLLAHLPPLRGAGADFGCGLGLLARAVLQSADVTALTGIDLDRRAIAAATANLPDLRARFLWADLRHWAPPAASLDFVVMNPPFHDHGIEDRALGQQFIARASAALKPGGACWLTANRHLPYEALLATHFAAVRLVAEADGFKIYAAEK